MKWNFRTEKHIDRKVTTFTATTDLEYGIKIAEWLDRKTIDQLVNKAVELWIEEYGDKLLAKITPEEVETRVKKDLAKRVLGED